MKKLSLLALLSICYLSTIPLAEAKKAKPFKCQEKGDNYLLSHYNAGCKYYNEQNYRKAYTEFEKVIYFFPSSEAAAEASYYLGVCYFEMKEYDFANREFSSYITASAHPAFFEDAVRFKFCIAEHFKNGKKKRAFDSRYCPKWMTAQDEALTIYDEVIVALPNHELTICALRSKAELLRKMGEYRDSVDTYQTLIRRFPKDESTPETYVRIAEVYTEQSQYEFQNPDILAFAELNARKFSEDFPRDERVEVVNGYVRRIKEIYAKGLCNLGLFYERKGHPHAAAIYYETSMKEFPDTDVACFCRTRLASLDYTKEKKDVVVPISTLIEELDPLEFEEKATVAEGNFFEGLPQEEAPGIEADRPSEREYDQYINELTHDPFAGTQYPPLETTSVQDQVFYDEAGNPIQGSYEVGGNDNQSPYQQEGSFNDQASAPVGTTYYQNYELSQDSFLIETPPGYDDQNPYPPSENDVYGEPNVVIGQEDDCFVTFENGQTISHPAPEFGEPGYYYRIIREEEPPPAEFVHYSLLKKRPVKRANQCQ